jgi:hypothetical protein
MKRTFKKEYIIAQKGCYSTKQVEALPFINNKRITLKILFDNLPIKDFTWFLVRKCDLTLTQKRLLAVHCAKQVLPIYEKRYPKDKRIHECVEATEQFIKGEIDIDTLRKKRAAAYAAATDAAAAYAYDAADADAAYAAYAAAYAATDAAYAAYADAAYAAYAATDAAYAADADAADDAAYRKSIWEFVKTLK